MNSRKAPSQDKQKKTNLGNAVQSPSVFLPLNQMIKSVNMVMNEKETDYDTYSTNVKNHLTKPEMKGRPKLLYASSASVRTWTSDCQDQTVERVVR